MKLLFEPAPSVHTIEPVAMLTRYPPQVLRIETRNWPLPTRLIALTWYGSHAVATEIASFAAAFVSDCESGMWLFSYALHVYRSLPVWRSYSCTAESMIVPFAGPPNAVRSMPERNFVAVTHASVPRTSSSCGVSIQPPVPFNVATGLYCWLTTNSSPLSTTPEPVTTPCHQLSAGLPAYVWVRKLSA